MTFFEFLNALGINPLAAFVKFGFFVISIIIAITVHEFAHAYAAFRLGDQTANFNRRLNLNPLNHLDPLGTLFIVLVGFGWGKPTPFNPWNLKNPRRDSALISIAGPFSNFLMAAAGAVLFRLIPSDLLVRDYFLGIFVQLNVFLGLFNLVPVAPLDGFKVIGGILPRHLYYGWQSLERYGFMILLFLILFGQDILSLLVGVPGRYLMRVLLFG